MPQQSLPNFFLIGVPKAGTTSLHGALGRHPDIGMSAVKEPKYFLTDQRPVKYTGPGDDYCAPVICDPDEYAALFAPLSDRPIRGESTPFYLWDPVALERIRTRVPDAKLVVVLRRPDERAYSNWSHMCAIGREPLLDFVAAWREEDRRLQAGWEPFWAYRSLGCYGSQLQRLLEIFPREQLHVVRYDDYSRDPGAAIDGICGFLGVGPFPADEPASVQRDNVHEFAPPSRRHRAMYAVLRSRHVVRPFLPATLQRAGRRVIEGQLKRNPGGSRPTVPVDALEEVRDYYRHDIELTAKLLALELDDWLQPSPAATA